MKWSRTIYRNCLCGETAFDAQFRSKGGDWVWEWECRNCKRPARDRKGKIKTMREHDRPGSSERGPG